VSSADRKKKSAVGGGENLREKMRRRESQGWQSGGRPGSVAAVVEMATIRKGRWKGKYREKKTESRRDDGD